MSLRRGLVAVVLLVSVSPILWTHYPSTADPDGAWAAAGLLLPRRPPLVSVPAHGHGTTLPADDATLAKSNERERLATQRSLFPVDVSALDFRYLSHAIIDEQHKLLVCAIPKVASSEFKKLFLRLQGDPDWRAEPWWKMRNLTTLYKVGVGACQAPPS